MLHAVTLQSTRPFTGFLIQARVPDLGLAFSEYDIVGTFVNDSVGPDAKILHCNASFDTPNSAENPVNLVIQDSSFTILSLLTHSLFLTAELNNKLSLYRSV